MSMRDVREEYHGRRLVEGDLQADPVEQARLWLDEAISMDLPLPNAMTLATVSEDGQPSTRVVLLKGIENGGFIFFTHHESRKGRELAANPKASFTLFWPALDRQLVVIGHAERIPVAQARAYFASRPYGSQLSAAASAQSRPTSRAQLEAEVRNLAARYPEGAEAIPMPDEWGGYRVLPDEVQFWHGRPNRLHDRFRYRREGKGQWTRQRLAP